MCIGRLLAAGKSWAGGHGPGRYRVNKHVQLPKFISPKNPFTPEGRDTHFETAPAVALAATIPHAAQVRRADALVRKCKSAVAKFLAMVVRARRGAGEQAMRVARWLGQWVQKLNPLPWLARRCRPARLAVNDFKLPAVQAELSLDSVKVLRNDLNDADLEVVLVKRPVLPEPKEQLVMASAGGDPAEGNPFSRVSGWVFGAKSP